MFFVLSKLLWALLSPLNVVIILLTAAMLAIYLKRNKIARLLGFAAWAVLMVFGVLPTGSVLMKFLESRYEVPNPMPWRVDGIIVLGGTIDTDIGLSRGAPQLDGTIDRLTTFIGLARRYPRAKLVFTAGIGAVDQSGVAEGQMIGDVLRRMNFNPGRRLMIDDRARTTYENALYGKELARPKPGQTWLLVTSASHLPRAVGVFKKLDWPVIAIPSDYQTDGTIRWLAGPSGFLGNMALSHMALKEMLGILAYGLTGKWDK